MRKRKDVTAKMSHMKDYEEALTLTNNIMAEKKLSDNEASRLINYTALNQIAISLTGIWDLLEQHEKEKGCDC